ncbi:MAG: LysE family transporter [Deltaproteobacteria bacterium]|nr:LysE family transporter [Deltaproteobacteria bacterium]
MNFGNPAAIFVSSFIIGLSGAMMPGPLLAVTVKHTSRRGFVAAPLLVLGHAILEAGLVCLLLFGLLEWIKGDAAVTAIALVGSAMLLHMAVGMGREVRTLRLGVAEGEIGAGDAGTGGGASALRPVLDGIVTSASNPYWSLWWATIGLGYLLLSRGQGTAGLLAFFTGHILSDAAWYLFVGTAVSAGRGWFTDRVYRGVVLACALFLVFFALSFGYFGVTRLIRSL